VGRDAIFRRPETHESSCPTPNEPADSAVEGRPFGTNYRFEQEGTEVEEKVTNGGDRASCFVRLLLSVTSVTSCSNAFDFHPFDFPSGKHGGPAVTVATLSHPTNTHRQPSGRPIPAPFRGNTPPVILEFASKNLPAGTDRL
jgi:hypothetical protein